MAPTAGFLKHTHTHTSIPICCSVDSFGSTFRRVRTSLASDYENMNVSGGEILIDAFVVISGINGVDFPP